MDNKLVPEGGVSRAVSWGGAFAQSLYLVPFLAVAAFVQINVPQISKDFRSVFHHPLPSE